MTATNARPVVGPNGLPLITFDGRQHPTRTYRGRPACAGSITEPVDFVPVTGASICPVCGRSDLSTTSTGKVNTHLHAEDLIR